MKTRSRLVRRVNAREYGMGATDSFIRGRPYVVRHAIEGDRLEARGDVGMMGGGRQGGRPIRPFPIICPSSCPTCGGRARTGDGTIFLIEVPIEHPQLTGGPRGVGRYFGCAACPFASPMIMIGNASR